MWKKRKMKNLQHLLSKAKRTTKQAIFNLDKDLLNCAVLELTLALEAVEELLKAEKDMELREAEWR